MNADAAAWNYSGELPVTVPFLEPSAEYRLDWAVADDGETGRIRFSTSPSPFAWASYKDARIFPGNDLHGCTLGFILRDVTNETLWAMTAGHCVEVGDRVIAYPYVPNPWINGTNDPPPPVPLGTVRFAVDEGALDWAFIEIDAESRSMVSPAVRQWTGPAGLLVPQDAAEGDTVCLYGQGGHYGNYEETRPRCGTFRGTERRSGGNHTFTVPIPADSGDSGSPIIHYPSGRAIGMLIEGLPPLGVDMAAVYVCSALSWLQQEHGVQLRLATAPYDPPEAMNVHFLFPQVVYPRGDPPPCMAQEWNP